MKASRSLVSADFILTSDVCILQWLVIAGRGMAIGIHIPPRLVNALANTLCAFQRLMKFWQVLFAVKAGEG